MKRPCEAIIEDIIVQPSKIQPIIVNFQNGELREDEDKNMSCGLFYDQKKQKTLLGLSNGQVVYKGYKPDTSNELIRTMLVLHNKRTGKVRMVQVERWQVSPVLQKPRVDDSVAGTDDKIALLNKQFGSKKVKRRTEQNERMKINIDSVKEQLEKTVSGVEIDRMDLSTQIQENDDLTNLSLPLCNRDATSIEDVYNVYDIIPSNTLETLFKAAESIINEYPESAEGKSKFFKHMLNHLKSNADNFEKVALLLYVEAVFNWLNMPMKDAKKRGVEVCSVSQEVDSFVKLTYSVSSNHGRTRPNSMKDKGVIHCMILALIISNFTLDIELFATIFTHRIGAKKLIDLARIIGALPSKEDKNIIALKLPLPAPAPVVKKGKKKGR